jgi:hypothetical protein
MDDREFSSPVCYLDYDNYQKPVARPVKPAFCSSCISFIDALGSNATEEDGISLEDLSREEKVKILLNGIDWVYKTAENIATTARKGCPFCIVIFEGLKLEEKERLVALDERGDKFPEGGLFEFRREINDGGLEFQIVSTPPKLEGRLCLEFGNG